MIDISSVNLKEFAKKVYELSSPVGMGFLHYQDGPLSDEQADSILSEGTENYPLRMDYVNGRQCKMGVFKNDGKLLINDSWYDHSESQFEALLTNFGITKS